MSDQQSNQPDRAKTVAAIRALADFVESRTDLPVPTSVRAQHTLRRPPGPQNEVIVRNVATMLDVAPVIYEDSAFATVEISRYPVEVDYTVYGRLSEPTGGES